MKIRQYIQRDFARAYLEELAMLAKEFGVDIVYGMGKRQEDTFVPVKPQIPDPRPDQESRMIQLFTEEQWQRILAGWQLIKDYKDCKGKGSHEVSGGYATEEDYWQGKRTVDDVLDEAKARKVKC